MGIKQVKVNVNELTLGMFVAGLDRPWTQTPFPLQGFYIRDTEEIASLKNHCRHVFIDVAKGSAPIRTSLKTIDVPAAPGITAVRQRRQKVNVAPLVFRRDFYEAPKPFRKEIRSARQLHQKVNFTIAELVRQLDENGVIPVKETQRVASELVDSVLRNPDAMTWLSRVRDKDEHTYSHSVRSAVWALIFGRHIGISKKELNVLAMGVLLKDVGKTRLDASLLALDAVSRSQQEELEYRRFVDYSVDILRNSEGVSPRVLAVVKNHCERIDGSGYPQGLVGDKIPLLARIAGIVTFYDDITNPRDKSQPVAPSKAISRLYDSRGHEFQEQLVVEFIRAIGLYPTGTLVELTTGDVAVVVEQNFSRRLKPKVMIVLDATRQVMSEPVLLDLAEDERQKQALIDNGQKSLEEVGKIEIVRDLEPGSCAVDIGAVRDSYMLDTAKRSLFSLFKRSK